MRPLKVVTQRTPGCEAGIGAYGAFKLLAGGNWRFRTRPKTVDPFPLRRVGLGVAFVAIGSGNRAEGPCPTWATPIGLVQRHTWM